MQDNASKAAGAGTPVEGGVSKAEGVGGRVMALALVAALAPFAFLVSKFNFLCDDAFITFRYSRNLSEGLGLVYNPSATPPVEGYSEYLWALLMALGLELGVGPESFSRFLSVGSGVLMVAGLVWALGRRFAGTPVATIGAAFVLGCAPPLGVWATGGMATMPTAALATWLFLLTYSGSAGVGESPRRGLLIGVVASLLALMRADGALLVALLLAPAMIVGAAAGTRRAWRAPLIGAGVSMGAFFGHMAWRHSVYGDWLPNTARVKLGFSPQATDRGLDYVLSAFLSMPGLAVAFGGAIVGCILAARRIGVGAALGVLALVTGVTAYSITSGGDFMCFARFLVPAIPFAILGFGALLRALESVARPLAALVALAAGVLSALSAFDVHVVPESTRLGYHFRHNQRLSGVALSTSEVQQWRNMDARARGWAETGRLLARYAPPEASLVYGAVGAIGYYSNLFIHDRNGLVTRSVAMRPPHEELRSPGHDKVVPPEFFLDQNPTYLDAGVWPEATFPPAQKAGRRLLVLGPAGRPGWILWVEPGPGPR